MGKKRQPLPKSLANDPRDSCSGDRDATDAFFGFGYPETVQELLQNCDAPNQIVGAARLARTWSTFLNRIRGRVPTRSGCGPGKFDLAKKPNGFKWIRTQNLRFAKSAEGRIRQAEVASALTVGCS
jgi:hypothetical protein